MLHTGDRVPGRQDRNTVVLTNGRLLPDDPSTWTGALDRSPCGTGTSARMAALHARGQLGLNEDFVHRSIIGSEFVGRLTGTTTVAEHAAVLPTITGRAWITGHTQWVLDENDPFPTGYTLGDIWAPPGLAPPTHFLLKAGVVSQFINGKILEGTSGQTVDVIDPSNGTTVDTISLAGSDDVKLAVQAARDAFPAWSRATPAERSAVLTKFAALMEERAEEFAQLESRQAGKPIRLTREFDVPGTIDNIAFFAGAARNLEGKATGEYSPDHTSSIRREAIGVIGSISPWNYPLQMAAWKILPAIAAGNTIVLKPAEITPLTTLLFAQVATEAGLPDGVINVLTGRGSTVGAELLRHPDVDMLSFTGSTVVGRTVLDAAATTAKRVHLELGGKAPFVVFDDADLEAAIHGAVAGSLINTGQDCTAATRAIVHRSLYEDFIAGVSGLYAKVKLGPTSDPATDLGPLVSEAHRDKVAEMVDRARGYARVLRRRNP